MSQVDVIMPVHNQNGVWLSEAQRSIADQPQIGKLAVISSSSLPKEIVAPSYEAIYTQINNGVALTKSKYILVFGSDDVMYPGMIQELVNVAEHSNAKVVYCNYEMMTENGNHMDYVRINPRYEFGLNCKTSHYPDVSLFRRDVVEEFGGWDVSKGRYAMWWLWLQIGRKYPNDIHHCPYFGFRYRQHEGGMHNRERRGDREAFVNSIREWLGHVPSISA